MDIIEDFLLVAMVVCFWIAYEILRKARKSPRIRRMFGALPISETLLEAGVSGKLVPRLDPFVENGAKIQIVGSDGSYSTKSRGNFWIESLERWLKRGAEIDYLLTSADEVALERYERLVEEYEGDFRLCVIDEDADLDPKLRSLLRDYASSHPTLLENTGNGTRVMWLEGRHPINSEYAYDIEFLVPPDALHDHRFERIKSEIASVLSSPACKKRTSPMNLKAA